MSSIFRPDPTRRVAKFIHGNHCPYPILETPKKKSFESKKSTLIYFRGIFLFFFVVVVFVVVVFFFFAELHEY